MTSHPCHHLRGLWTKWPFWQGWSFYKGSATRISAHPGRPSDGHYWGSNLPVAETDTESQTWHYFQGWSVRLITWTASIMEGAIALTGIETPDNDLPSLLAMLLSKLSSMELENDLPTIMLFHTVLLLIKEITSQKFAYHPEAAGLVEQWNGILKTQLQHKLDDNALQCWGKALQKTVYVENRCPTYGAVAARVRTHRSGSENGNSSTHYYLLVIHWHIFCFLFPWPDVLLVYKSLPQSRRHNDNSISW